MIKIIGEVNGYLDYVVCFWLLFFKFYLNLFEKKLLKCLENVVNCIFERLKFKIFWGGGDMFLNFFSNFCLFWLVVWFGYGIGDVCIIIIWRLGL